MTRGAVFLLVAALALAASPAALAARAAEPPPQAPGLLAIGAYEHALVQLERGSLADAGGTLVSRRHRIWRLPTRTAERVLPRLLSTRAVAWVEPDVPVRPLRVEADPLAGLEWWRPAIGADAVAPPGPGKPVTVLDTGIDLSHEEFAGRPNTAVLGSQNITESNEEFHGTAVSSVIAAPENGVGIVGVYPQASLRSADVHRLRLSDVVAALDAAVSAGPSVINMSFGLEYSRFLEDMILGAFGTGSIVVAAAGNERQRGSPATAPANLKHVLTVAATDRENRPATFSTASSRVDLAAPGIDIPAAVPLAFSSTGYTILDGTSFSAPLVAGATAWVWTARPELDHTQVFDLMRHSARDLPPREFDRDTGFGLLDIPAALALPAPSPDPQEPNDDIRQVRANGRFWSAKPAVTRPRRARGALTARLDATEDPEDVYRVYVPAGRVVRISATPSTDVDVDLWRPSATSVTALGPARTRNLFATSGRRGRVVERVSARNRGRRGFYAYLSVYLPRNGPLDAQYSISVSTARR